MKSINKLLISAVSAISLAMPLVGLVAQPNHQNKVQSKVRTTNHQNKVQDLNIRHK
nr:hypothetical protein [Mycoplasmopsis bovis]